MIKQYRLLAATTCVLLLMLLTLTSCAPAGNVGTANQQETVYDRIIKTGKIRAAYITYPPAVMKNTATGQMTGTFVDVLEKAADNLGLKVEWTEEVGWGAQIEGLEANRYDIVGSPVWANPTRGKVTTMSTPVYYSGIGIYVRKDDNRFTANNLGLINASDVKIVTIDGETGDLIARTQFSKAQRVSLPQLSDISELFLNVKTGKADVLFAEPFFGHQFLEANPDSVKNIASEHPVKTLGNCYMFKKDEFQMKHMLDVAIADLLGSGYVDTVLDKYEPAPNTFYRVALPYRIK